MTDIEYLKKYYKGNIEDGIKRLKNGEPVQYIVGNVNFYGYIYNVNKNVLIPRFETEELVNKTINYIKKYFDKKINIIDLGTGSGSIAITLKNEIDCDMTAVDISKSALEVAKSNALKYRQDINFIHSNMFLNVTSKYDVIISNPPYISYDEPIMDIVKNNEPSLALYADNNGLYYYEDIIKNASNYLNEKNMLAFEIGYLQGNDIINIAKKYMPNAKVSLEKDMQGKDRFIFIFNNLD